MTEFTPLGPVGWLVYAKAHPAEAVPHGPAVQPLTPARLTTLQAVNAAVNAAIAPRNDIGKDVWTLEPTHGDCDDYTVTKRHRLIAAGLSPSALRMAVGHTAAGEQHVVLVVRTTAGDLVLDNLTARILPISACTHRWTMFSSADPRVWTEKLA